jgi:hypothetical protein
MTASRETQAITGYPIKIETTVHHILAFKGAPLSIEQIARNFHRNIKIISIFSVICWIYAD